MAENASFYAELAKQLQRTSDGLAHMRLTYYRTMTDKKDYRTIPSVHM